MDRRLIAAWSVALATGLLVAYLTYEIERPGSPIPPVAYLAFAFAIPIVAAVIVALRWPERTMARTALAAAFALAFGIGVASMAWSRFPEQMPRDVAERYLIQRTTALAVELLLLVAAIGWTFRPTRRWTLALRAAALLALVRLGILVVLNAAPYQTGPLRMYAITGLLLGAIPLAALALTLPDPKEPTTL